MERCARAFKDDEQGDEDGAEGRGDGRLTDVACRASGPTAPCTLPGRGVFTRGGSGFTCY